MWWSTTGWRMPGSSSWRPPPPAGWTWASHRADRSGRTRSTPSWWARAAPAGWWFGSRGAIRTCSAGAGRKWLALQAAGVPFEVVPGVTAAIAVPAFAGVPVTHRGLATSFTVVTGHSRHAVDRETNWEALAAVGGTIVVLMGVAHRQTIADRLIGAGLAPDTPVLAVHWGTRPEQRSWRVRLDRLGATSLEPPVTLVIGSVAGLELGWYEQRPLFGRRVVVTRARAQASALSARLREARRPGDRGCDHTHRPAR